MPRIFKIQPSQRTITTQSPNAPIQQPGGLSNAIIALGQTGKEVGEKIRAAKSLAEKTRAENFRDSHLIDIQNRVDQDNDVSESNRRKYQDEIDKVLSDSSNQITIPALRELFYQDSLSKTNIVKGRIDNAFISKAIDVGKEELTTFGLTKKDEFIKSTSVQDKQRVRFEMENKINEALEAGYIQPKDAAVMRREYPTEWGKAQVEYDITTKPDFALEMLNNKKYDNISELERVNFMKDAEKAITKIDSDAKLFLKNQQLKNEAKFIDEFAGGQLTFFNTFDIGQAIARQEIRPEFGNALIKAVNTPFEDFELEDDDEAFLSMVNGVLEASNEQDINNVLLDILNGFSSGNLGQRNMQLLIEASRKFGEDREFKNQLRNVVTTGIKAGLTGIHVDSEMAGDYIRKVNDGKTPIEAAAESIRDKQIKLNPDRANYEIGQIITRGNRSARVIGYREDGMPLVEVVNAR